MPLLSRILAKSKIASIWASLNRARIASGFGCAGALPSRRRVRRAPSPRRPGRSARRAHRSACTRCRRRGRSGAPHCEHATWRTVGAQLGELDRRWGANEVLFAQEMMEGDELPVVVAAPPVGESRRALQIVGEGKRLRADRAIELARQRIAGAPGAADESKHLEHRPGREPHALQLVEPEQVARRARRNLDRTERCRRPPAGAAPSFRGSSSNRACRHSKVSEWPSAAALERTENAAPSRRAVEVLVLMVPVEGVEPSTFALRMRCSTN